jgi:D-glycero-D-manno-heptose 1,7-bisphosphate phosphatase
MHLQAGAAIGAQLHLLCTGESAGIAPGQPLPPGWPDDVRIHADLAAFADQLLHKADAPSA